MERIHLVMVYPEEEEKKAAKSVEEMLRMAPARSVSDFEEKPNLKTDTNILLFQSLKKATGVAKGVQWGTSCTRLFEWCQGFETVPSDKRSPSLAMRYSHHLMVTESLADVSFFKSNYEYNSIISSFSERGFRQIVRGGRWTTRGHAARLFRSRRPGGAPAICRSGGGRRCKLFLHVSSK